jgi:16S rRNA C1402 N4-methylase RsmH
VLVWLGVTRLSNIFHTGFSYMRDKQMDLRIARRTGR